MRAACLALALCLGSPTALAQEPAAGEPAAEEAPDALDALLEQEVVILRTDGSEIPGTLLGVTEQSLTVVKTDGRIVTVRRAEVDSVVPATAPTAVPAPAPAPVAKPAPKPAPVPRPAEERVLVGAAYTGQYFDLFDPSGHRNPIDGAFFGGRAYRYFLFVDQDGRRLSQSNAWALMGDPGAYRRYSGQSVILPLQVGSTVLGIGGLLAAIGGPRISNWSLPLIFGGLGLGITSSALRPIFERERGKKALEKAQEVYGPQAVGTQ